LVNDELYWRAANDTRMKCITPEEGQIILQDIHVGVYGCHTSVKSLVGKMYRQGFFWLTTVSDADSIVCRCEGCQFFARQKYVSSHQLQTIPITCHFSTWGRDLVGPFKKAKGGFTHIFIVVINSQNGSKRSLPPPSQWKRQLNSSKRSCRGFASPTTLSLILGLSLLQGSSRTFV
jgi:hypothetical protein